MRGSESRLWRFGVIVVGLTCLDWLPKMDAVECFSTANGRMVQFFCGPSELCCGSECCKDDAPFYTHWYFWLAVCMFTLVIVGVALSACRHFRKQRKHQHCCVRNKPEFSVDLLLNYHLLRTDVITLPQYDHLVSAPPTTHPPSLSPPSPLPLLLPPSYCDACATGSSSSSDNSYTSAEPNDQPPPAYSECVMQN